jgi:hypothetical protein
MMMEIDAHLEQWAGMEFLGAKGEKYLYSWMFAQSEAAVYLNTF